MSARRVRFIGGPMDGRRMALPEQTPAICFPQFAFKPMQEQPDRVDHDYALIGEAFDGFDLFMYVGRR